MLPGDFEKVGVIGLGIIGSRVAENLRNAGKHVYVWSRTPKPEPNFLGSPAEVAQNSQAIQIFVTNGEALIEVLEAMESHLTSSHLIMNHATVDLASVIKASSIVQASGAQFLDCPFTGSKDAAASGKLVYYIGGGDSAIERARPLLELTSKHIQAVGKVGDATVVKIATNMVSATTVQVLSEALALTQAAGVDGTKFVDAMLVNACCSDLARMKLPTMLEGDYQTHFSLKNMFKDAQFALTLANDSHVEVPALSTTASVMFKSIQKGNGEDDYSVLYQNFTEKKKSSSKKGT